MSLENEFIDLCLNGKLNEAKEFYKNNPNVNIIYDNAEAFCLACEYEHLEVAKWLLDIEPLIKQYIDEKLFINLCEFGKLEVAQWLISVKPDIDISAEDEEAFRFACKRGQLKVAKWLISIKPDIDISAECDYAFIISCRNGELEVAKWLLEIKSDIDKREAARKAARTQPSSQTESHEIKLWHRLKDTLNECPPIKAQSTYLFNIIPIAHRSRSIIARTRSLIDHQLPLPALA